MISIYTDEFIQVIWNWRLGAVSSFDNKNPIYLNGGQNETTNNQIN